MSTELRDLASGVKPAPLQEYLRSRGWQLEDDATQARGVASYVKDGVVVDVPQRVAFVDYSRRVVEVLGLIAVMESRSAFALAEDLLRPDGDVLGVRVISESARTGTLPLADSLKLREAAKNLLLASAHSVLSPVDYFPRMGRVEAASLIASVREGQNQRGSFIARFIVPVEPAVGEQLDVADAPFGRRVMSLLLRAMDKVQQVRSLGAYDKLLDMAAEGVSGNLLSALHSMSAVVGAGSVEFGVDWARNRPAPSQLPSRIIFPTELLDGLDAVADNLKRRVQAKGVAVEGFVIRLDRTTTNGPGEVVVLQDDEVKRVSVALDEASYGVAIQAHEAGQPVRVVGTLGKQGRRWHLTEATGFEILPPGTDDDGV